jgi:carbamoyl-phosphate synthase small subunit
MKKMKNNWNWKEKREKPAFLALADGTILRGHSVGAKADGVGEVVFNTGLSGYQEILSDPSYAGQFVTMTYPEIGNTGINMPDMESRKMFLNGFVIHEMNEPSSWRCEESLADALSDRGIPAIAGLDTRYLTSLLREKGTQKAYMSVEGKVGEEDALAKARAWDGLDGQDYAAKVTCDEAFKWDESGELTGSWGIAEELPKIDLNIVAYDFGIKWNILRSMRLHGMDVTVVPAKTSAADVLAMKPQGVFLSNGPADPAAVTYAVDAARELLGKVPLMGICLGHQILGLATGGSTYRLKFGHHGCNHPVMDLKTRKVEITSQNHNFAVDPDTVDKAAIEVTHVNLNDQTVEGIEHKKEPMFSLQYHPEACPGPHDPYYLFGRFRDLIKNA